MPDLSKYSVSTFWDGLAIVEQTKAKKYGAIDESGIWLLKPQDLPIYCCGEGILAFQRKGSYLGDAKECCGLMDRHGKVLAVPQYQNRPLFHNGTAFATRKHKTHESFELLGKDGKVIRQLTELAGLSSSSQDLTPVLLNANYKWGAMDEFGNIKVPCKFDSLSIVTDGTLLAKEGDLYFLIDESGRRLSLCGDTQK